MRIAMPHNSPTRKSAAAALRAAVGIALLFATGTAVLAGDDEDDDWWDVKAFKMLLRGVGLRNGQEAGIEYKERPPLVVPPGRNLPAPIPPEAATIKNPAWPADPDEARRAAERKAKKERKAYNPYTSGDSLKPSELAQKSDKPSVKTSNGPDYSPEMTPSQLGFNNSMFSGLFGLGKSFTGEKDVETRQFVREPTRASLTDPPSGYRTPSPVQPYGINGKADKPKASATDRQVDTVNK